MRKLHTRRHIPSTNTSSSWIIMVSRHSPPSLPSSWFFCFSFLLFYFTFRVNGWGMWAPVPPTLAHMQFPDQCLSLNNQKTHFHLLHHHYHPQYKNWIAIKGNHVNMRWNSSTSLQWKMSKSMFLTLNVLSNSFWKPFLKKGCQCVVTNFQVSSTNY